ncbi:hypothetical protein NEPAR08_2367 [Nematocida parisii]|nr:hypothetical protein NEPAR08_2367 [Nematocida parisii]
MIRSEYEKKREKLKDTKKTHKSEGKKTKQKEIDEKEINSKISEAEALDLCTIDAESLAEQLTLTEIRILIDITPVEILKFNYENEEEVSPTLAGYIKFTNGLSSYVTSSIFECEEPQTKSSSEKRQFHAQSEVEAAQNHWKSVMEKLLDKNNRNSLTSIYNGIMKTNPPRILKEQIFDLHTKATEEISQETEKELQSVNTQYIRDVKTIEKHLIDASYSKNDKDTPAKFRRIIEYLNYIRAQPPKDVDEKINHAIIHKFRNMKDIRMATGKDGSVLYSGCFLFLEHSHFISLE